MSASAALAAPPARLPASVSRGLMGLVLPAGLLALWRYASSHAWLPPQILPSPGEV